MRFDKLGSDPGWANVPSLISDLSRSLPDWSSPQELQKELAEMRPMLQQLQSRNNELEKQHTAILENVTVVEKERDEALARLDELTSSHRKAQAQLETLQGQTLGS